MTRYFYTDPLAAAWMAKHFRMRFTFGDEEITFTWEASLVWSMPDAKFYIHPDSLSLLEPKNGDKVSYSFGFGQHAGEAWDEVKGVILAGDEGYPYTGNGEPYVLVDGCDEFPLGRLQQIFQRDRKPFHWPESEAA